jgi:hypothetical protein
MNIENKDIDVNEFPLWGSGGLPKNYFEKLSNRILDRINQKQQLYSLENLEKVNVFKVPDGYFEELPNRIEAKIEKPKSSFQIIRNTKFWAAAASILIVVGLAWYFLIPQKSEVDLALENVSKDEIQTYLSHQDLSYLEMEAETKIDKIQVDSLILDNLQINYWLLIISEQINLITKNIKYNLH